MRAISSERLYTAACLAGALAALVFGLGYVLTLSPPRDAQGLLIGHDFVNVWMGARAALSGHPAALFGFAHYQTLLRDAFGAMPAHNWSYPPHLFLMIWPLGFLPYFWALAAWCAAGLALYLFAATRGGTSGREILFLLASPAVVMNLLAGQNGFFSAALLIGGLYLLDRRPLLAGLLFSLMTLKPQLGVLVPAMLVASGRWRVLAAAAAGAAALFLATGWCFGFSIWSDYLRLALPVQTAVMEVDGGVAPAMMPTIFIAARMIGAPVATAYLAQAIVAVAALGAVAWAFAKPRDPALSRALLIAAAFLATPYAFSYDMPVFAWAILELRRRGGDGAWDTALAVAVWLLPLAMIPFAQHGIPLAPLVLMAFAGRLAWRVRGTLSGRPAVLYPAAAGSQYID